MPNKKNFNRLIRQLKNTKHTNASTLPGGFDGEHFNLGSWQFNCGAPACIAGHGYYIFGDKAKMTPLGAMGISETLEPPEMKRLTADSLGLDYLWASNNLFNPRDAVTLSWVTPQDAIDALKTILAAGENYQRLSVFEVWKGYRDRRFAELKAKEEAEAAAFM